MHVSNIALYCFKLRSVVLDYEQVNNWKIQVLIRDWAYQDLFK